MIHILAVLSTDWFVEFRGKAGFCSLGSTAVLRRVLSARRVAHLCAGGVEDP